MQLAEFHYYDKTATRGQISIIKEILADLDSVWEEKVKLLQSQDKNDWKQDPTLPDGFMVREKVRSDGVKVDRYYLNSEGTLIFRSRPAVYEYLKAIEGTDRCHFLGP